MTVGNVYIIGSHCIVVHFTPTKRIFHSGERDMFSPMFLNDVADYHNKQLLDEAMSDIEIYSVETSNVGHYLGKTE